MRFKNLRRMGLAAFVASATAVGGPITLGMEGMELKPYYDSVGVKTVCGGETHKVEDREYSLEECTEMFAVRYGYFSYSTARYYNDTAKGVVTPEIHAAMTDMSYNVGLGAVRKSTMIRELNRGNVPAACAAIKRYKYAGGRDCTIRANNCYGIWTRRLAIYDLCMKGAAI